MSCLKIVRFLRLKTHFPCEPSSATFLEQARDFSTSRAKRALETRFLALS